MTELEKMEQAQIFIKKLANGINPINDTLTDDSEVINNIHVSRCLFYVSDLLQQIIEKENTSGKKVKKQPFTINNQQLSKFELSDKPITISEIVRRLNELADLSSVKKLTYSDIAYRLLEFGFLEEIDIGNGKAHKRPTKAGIDLGISVEERIGIRGPYTAVVYNREAQQFILDNLNTFLKKDII